MGIVKRLNSRLQSKYQAIQPYKEELKKLMAKAKAYFLLVDKLQKGPELVRSQLEQELLNAEKKTVSL